MPKDPLNSRYLNIRLVSHLALRLGINEKELHHVSSNMDKYVEQVKVTKSNGKIRTTYRAKPRLKSVLRSIQVSLLEPLPLPSTLHGGIKNKSPKSNAAPHIAQEYVVTLDIRDFYPSIHHTRVHHLFLNLGCTYPVAKLLTRLVTFNGSVAQGFPTSTAIANLIVSEFEPRFVNLCEQHRLTITFFQDDITISGGHRAVKLVNLFIKVLHQCGLKINGRKLKIQPKDVEQKVTGIVVNNRLDIPQEYYEEVHITLQQCLDNGGHLQVDDPQYFLRSLHGRIQWIRDINKDKGEILLQKYRLLTFDAL